MDQDLVKLLEQTGFTQKEAEVYLALLELGQGNVTEISKVTGLKRSIIYVLLEGLIKRGYANEVPNKKINTYHALDPSVILTQLRTTTKNFSEMLPMLRTLHNKGKVRPKIIYHETKEGILNVYKEMNEAKDAFFISSYEKIDKVFPKVIDEWINNYRKGLINLQRGRHLVSNNEFNREIMRKFKELNQEVRYLPDVKDFSMDFTLYDNKLDITSLEEEPFIVVIESESLVNSIKPIFEIAWKSGKEIK